MANNTPDSTLQGFLDEFKNSGIQSPSLTAANSGVLDSFSSTESSNMANSVAYGTKENTKASRIEEATLGNVGKVIAAGTRNKYTGWAVNPALNVAQFIGQKIIDPATRVVTAGLLASRATASGKGLGYAWEQAKEISPGQAFASSFSSVNVFDAKQRTAAFEDNWIGVIASGTIDLGFNIAGSKGISAVRKGLQAATLGSNAIKDVSILRPIAEEAITWGEAGGSQVSKAPSAFAHFIDQAVVTKDAGALRNNLFVMNSQHPDRLATLLAGVNTHRAATEIVMAERGDMAALNNLRDSLPLAHDALTNFGFDVTKPLPDFKSIHSVPSPDEAAQYQNILDALAKKDKYFAKHLDAFVSDVSSGEAITSWQPSRFAAVDKISALPQAFKSAALMGDWGYLKGAWNVTEFTGDRYTRGVRFFRWAAGSRPQGHINVSNPRVGESVQDLLSEMNRVHFLRDNVDFKESQVRLYTRAANDSERAVALGAIERNILVQMAKHYNIGNIREVLKRGGGVQEEVNQLHRIWNDLNDTRSGAIEFLNKNKYITGEDGSLNFITGTSIPKGVNFGSALPQNMIAVSTEPVHVPMLDFRRLEAEVIGNLNDLNKSNTARVGAKFDLSKKDVAYAHLHNNSVVMGLHQVGDIANMLFSNLNLLRIAFIPKNSIVDPVMRANMALNHLVGLSDNGSQMIMGTMARNAKRRAWTIPAVTMKARYGREAKALAATIDDIKTDMGKTEQALVLSNKKVAKSTSKYAALVHERDRVKGKDAASVAERQRLDDLAQKEKTRLDSLTLDNDILNSQYSNFVKARQAALTEQAHNISKIYDAKSAVEYVGKEKFVYRDKNGNTVEIGGVFDPNARGASAYRAEADSWMNFYATQRQSETIMRMNRETGWNQIVPNTSDTAAMADYWEALSHIANRNVRQELDLVLGKLNRGESIDSVMAWMRSTSAGREYERRIASRLNDTHLNTLEDDQLRAWLSYTQGNINSIFPSKELRDIINTRPVTSEEIKSYLEGYADDLRPVYGPTTRSAFKSATIGQKVGIAAEAVPRLGWKMISEVENKVARMPLFRDYWSQEMRQAAKYLENQGVEITYDLLNGPIRQQSYRKALARVEQTLYSSRRLTNGGYALRYLMAFPGAFFNSQKVALRAMARNPWNAYWYNSVMQSTESPLFGAYYEDKDGNTYSKLKDVPAGVDVSVRVSLPAVLEKKMKGMGFDAYFDPSLGGLKINQKQLQFMLGDPGISWIAGASLSAVIQKATDQPIAGVTGEDIIAGLKKTFGEDFYNQSIMFQGNLVKGSNLVEMLGNQMLPTYAQFLLAYGNFGPGQSDLSDEANRLYRMQYREWLASGQDETLKPDYEKAMKTARNMMVVRAIISNAAPLATSFDPATREAAANMSKLMAKNNNDYKAATDEYIKLYGWESMALLGSSNYRPLGQGATVSDQQILDNNRNLIADIVKKSGSPESAAMLFFGGNGDNKSEYDTGIASIQAEMTIPGSGGDKLVQTKSPKQIRDDMETRLGWYEYMKLDQWRQSMMEMYGIKNTSSGLYITSGLSARFTAGENELRNKYPAWDASRKFNRQNWYTVVGSALDTAVADSKWMQSQSKVSPMWNEIAEFMNAEHQVRQAYMSATTQEQKSFVSNQFDVFYNYMVANSSTQFSQFASRYLSNHPLLTVG